MQWLYLIGAVLGAILPLSQLVPFVRRMALIYLYSSANYFKTTSPLSLAWMSSSLRLRCGCLFFRKDDGVG